MEKIVRIIKEFKITIPDEDIPELLKPYREVIDSNADEDSLFKQVAYTVGEFDEYFVEGIGIVLRKGEIPFQYRDRKSSLTKIDTEELDTEIEID